MAKDGCNEQETGNGFVYDKNGNFTLPKPEKSGAFTVQTPTGTVRGDGAMSKKLPYDGMDD